jgi:hypothetical protein
MSQINYSDLRLYARFEFIQTAMVHAEGVEEPFRTMLVDIGLGGVQLRSRELIPVDTPLTLHLGQDDQPPLQLKGRVKYCNPGGDDGMYISGFKFTPETHQERVAIAEFVHRVFQQQWEILAS